MNLTDFFTPAAIAAHWSEVASNEIPYLGASLFPSRKKAGLDLRWIKGSRGLPVSLMPSAFDAKATFRDRIGVTITETEMPFFREGYHLKERDRQEILRVQESRDPYAAEVLSRVFDDTNDLIRGALVVPERMIMQLLFTGKINITAEDVAYEYDYCKGTQWETENKITLSKDSWDKPETSDPFATFKTVRDKAAAKTGTVLTRAIMNTTTFNLMAKSTALKNRYLTNTGLALGYLTEAEVRNVVLDTSGITVAVYDKQFRTENGAETKLFVPDGYMAVIPDGTLGSTWFGTTPEEADLMGGVSNASVSVVNTGVALTTFLTEHPVNLTTLASEIVLPSFERMDECYLVKVTADG